MEKIKGFENYSITKDGKLWSEKYYKVLAPYVNYKGYHCIKLHNEGKIFSTTIHRLVALTYIENPENKPQVNHINGDKSDNRVENLEWVTSSENQLHAYKNGLKKPCFHDRFYRGKLLLDINTGIYYQSINEAANLLGYNKGTLRDYISGKKRNKTSLIAV